MCYCTLSHLYELALVWTWWICVSFNHIDDKCHGFIMHVCSQNDWNVAVICQCKFAFCLYVWGWVCVGSVGVCVCKRMYVHCMLANGGMWMKTNTWKYTWPRTKLTCEDWCHWCVQDPGPRLFSAGGLRVLAGAEWMKWSQNRLILQFFVEFARGFSPKTSPLLTCYWIHNIHPPKFYIHNRI